MNATLRASVETPRLRPFARLGTVTAWGMRRTLTSGRFILTALLSAVGAYGIGHLIATESTPAYDLWQFLENGLLGVAVPLVALAVVGTGYGEEVQDQTLVWHLVRPVSRTTVFVGRFLSGAMAAIVCAAAMVVALVIGSGIAVPRGAVVGAAAAAALGAASMGAIYYTLAALFRRGLIAGLVYTFVVEVFFKNLPGTIQRLSLSHHVRSVFHRLTDADFATVSPKIAEDVARGPAPEMGGVRPLAASEMEAWTTLPSGIAICVVVAAVALFIGARRVRSRDFALKD